VSAHDSPPPEQVTPERGSALPDSLSRLQLSVDEFDVLELAALRGKAHDVAALAARRGVSLPALGRVTAEGDRITMCFRPGRWLLLARSQTTSGAAAEWQAACTGLGAVIDLSSGLSAFWLAGSGAAIRTALARGCRLDLDPQVFPVGHAAATIIAQVSVILASLADRMLLLTPSTTARHFREWLGAHVL
jgi:sarcosine oxidase subunit gamma